jgi:hypothetical protein
MSKSRIKRQATPEEQPAGWEGVIRDAEAEIAVYEGRIARLRRVILASRIQVEAGVPFPEMPPETD